MNWSAFFDAKFFDAKRQGFIATLALSLVVLLASSAAFAQRRPATAPDVRYSCAVDRLVKPNVAVKLTIEYDIWTKDKVCERRLVGNKEKNAITMAICHFDAKYIRPEGPAAKDSIERQTGAFEGYGRIPNGVANYAGTCKLVK